MDMEMLTAAALIAFVLMQFVNALLKPFIEIVNKAATGGAVKEDVLTLWPLYFTVLVAGGIGWFAGLNLLPMFDPPMIGRVLTAIGIGLGPSFLYDLTDSK
jgi:hypothetical protein